MPDRWREVAINGNSVKYDARRPQINSTQEPLVEVGADGEFGSVNVNAAVEARQGVSQPAPGFSLRRKAALLDLAAAPIRTGLQVMTVVPGAVLLVARNPPTSVVQQ
jgi:hypothetical protein